MKRFVETSRGWIELEFVAHPGGRFLGRMGLLRGYSVLITLFGSDGWSEADEIGWLSAAPPEGRLWTTSLRRWSASRTRKPIKS